MNRLPGESDNSANELESLRAALQHANAQKTLAITTLKRDRTQFALLLKSKNEQISTLSNDIENANARATSAESNPADIDALRKQLAEQDKQLSSNTVKVERYYQLDAERTTLLRRVSELEGQRAMDASQLAELRARHDTTTKAHVTSLERAREYEVEIAQLKHTRRSLESKIGDSQYTEDLIKDLREEIGALGDANSQIREQLTAADSDRDSARAQVSAHAEEVRNHRSTIEKLEQNIADLSSDLVAQNDIANALSETESDNASLRETLSNLQTQAGTLAAERDDALAQASARTDTVEQMRRKTEELTNDLAAQSALADASQASVSELSALREDVSTLHTQAGVLTAERDDALARARAHDEQTQTHARTIEQMRSDIDVLARDLATQTEIASTLPAAEAELVTLKAELSETVKKADSIAASYESLNATCGQLKSTISSLESQRDSAMLERDNIRSESEAKHTDASRVPELEATCARMRHGITSLENQLDKTKSKLLNANEELGIKALEIRELKDNLTESIPVDADSVSDHRTDAYANLSDKYRALWWENKMLKTDLSERSNSSDSGKKDLKAESDQMLALRAEILSMQLELNTLRGNQHLTQDSHPDYRAEFDTGRDQK